MRRSILFIALALVCAACSDVFTPAASSPVPAVVAQVATTITLTTIRGIGTTADRGYLTAHIFDAVGKAMLVGGVLRQGWAK